MTKIAFYSPHRYDTETFDEINKQFKHEIHYIETRLTAKTVALAAGYDAVVIFVNDECDAEVLDKLKEVGVKYVLLRCAGFNNVNLVKAKEIGIKVVRVPAYSPDAVAEFAVGMTLTLLRKYHKAYSRVREGNFLLEGLAGSNIRGKTVGIIGTGKIGLSAGKIFALGFGATVIAYDPYQAKDADKYGVTYVSLDELFARSDIISIHCPLLDSTKYIINEQSIAKMKDSVVLVNTSRGGLIDTAALIKALKAGKFGAVGMDVYEKEQDYFFQDSSDKIIQDDQLSRLLSFHNVFVTGHQAFLTIEALHQIAETTLQNLNDLEAGECKNLVTE